MVRAMTKPAWILIQPARDAEGGFVAHHLEFDLAVRGDTPLAALGSCLGVVAQEVAVVESTGDVLPPSADDEYYETAELTARLGSATSLDEPHDVWAVDGERVVGLRLRDHPGLVVHSRLPGEDF